METLQVENSTTVRAEQGHPEPLSGDATAAGTRSQLPTAPQPQTEAAWLGRGWRIALLRRTMGLLSAAAPALAVRLLERLWFTPPRARTDAAARRWLGRARPLEVRAHGKAVRTWTWGKGPAVLLVHGWGGNAGQMHALGEALHARGLRVIAFDAPGHGHSAPARAGGRVDMVEFAHALRVVAAGCGPLLGVVAHSGGCTATALALREGWAGAPRMAFIAPFASPSQAVMPFGRAIGASDAVTGRFSRRVQARFARPWTDFDMATLPASRVPDRSLVVHDAGDREVPAAHGRALAAAWPGARWMETSGLGHRRLLRDPAVVAGIADFIAAGHRPAPPRPADARDELDHEFCSAGRGADAHR